MIVTIKSTHASAARCLAGVEAFSRSGHFWARAAVAAAAGLALCATTTADVPPALMKPIPVLAVENPLADARGSVLPCCINAVAPSHDRERANVDLRSARLEEFFRRYHCRPPFHIAEYLRAADDYALDYRLLPAISIRETRCGATEKDNNRWGFHPGQEAGFPSIAAGIEFMAHRIARHPLYTGKTLEDKLFTFNPRPAYPQEVQRIMRQIE